jgi:hypothetical protein
MTLGELVAVYPLQKGLAELLTYVALAVQQDAGHEIDAGGWEELPLGEDGRVVRLPRVQFKRDNTAIGTDDE